MLTLGDTTAVGRGLCVDEPPEDEHPVATAIVSAASAMAVAAHRGRLELLVIGPPGLMIGPLVAQ
jgi:hypothetical protein